LGDGTLGYMLINAVGNLVDPVDDDQGGGQPGNRDA
jgi:hypothetical protein